MTTEATLERPLDGVRVLDLARFIAGPLCCLLLSDLGAEVIKLENPGVGDDSRQAGPFSNGESLYFISHNRGKRGITLNLLTQDGVEVFKELLKISDVVVENFRPGVMDSFGLAYPQLREVNPRIILTSISGFGQDGPYRFRPGFDPIVQAMGGTQFLTGYEDRPPVRCGVYVADYGAGMYGAMATLAALKQRDRTGEGQYVDAALAVFGIDPKHRCPVFADTEVIVRQIARHRHLRSKTHRTSGYASRPRAAPRPP